MKITIEVNTSEPVPFEKIQKAIRSIVKTATEYEDVISEGLSITERIKTLDGKIVGFVELDAEGK